MIKVKKIIKKTAKKAAKKRDLTDIGKKKIIKKKQEKKVDKIKKEVKKKPKKEVKKVITEPSDKTSVKYFETTGSRKTSQARIRLFTQGGNKEIRVNEKSFDVYFITSDLQKIVQSPLEIISSLDKFRISVKVKGGGIHSQAEAVRHGISRALCLLNPYFKKKLKKEGFLTRDSRMRERKKFGLKRARRAPQWSKR